MIKFGIYTSFYNCEKFIESAFSQIENLNYGNFEWHITDDFSNDNTKELVLQRLKKSPIKDKIGYYVQSYKKEMYWKPNEFFDDTFDWIVLVDADDYINPNTLRVYNYMLGLYSNDHLSFISSDFHKIDYESGKLHSISYILNEEPISRKIERYHPKCDYLNNISYSCFGVLRAFRHSSDIKFEVKNRYAGAEDSYRVFWCNSHGKYLHIPRVLYQWNMHKKSESHSDNIIPGFNDNFDMALDKLKKGDYGVITIFNEVYSETCALNSYDFNKLNGSNVSLWTRTLTQEQKEKLTNLYFDCNLSFDDSEADIHIFCLNYFRDEELVEMVKSVVDKKILLYYQNQKKHFTSNAKDQESKEKLIHYRKLLSNCGIGGYSWWMYIRHFIIKN